VTVGLSVDTEQPSRLVDGERQAARNFSRRIIPGDKRILISFDATTASAMDARTPAACLGGSRSLRQNSPHFNMRGGMESRGHRAFRTQSNGVTSSCEKSLARKAIVLITEGWDVGSAHRIDAAIDRRRAGRSNHLQVIICRIRRITVADAWHSAGAVGLQRCRSRRGGRFFHVERIHRQEKSSTDSGEMRSPFRSMYVRQEARRRRPLPAPRWVLLSEAGTFKGAGRGTGIIQ